MAFNRPLIEISAINQQCASAISDDDISAVVEKARNLLARYTDTAQKEILISLFDSRLRGQRLTSS